MKTGKIIRFYEIGINNFNKHNHNNYRQNKYFTKQAKYYCINITQILLSEFGFILILGLILFLVYIIPQYHSKKIFTSKQKLDYNNDPIIFIHTTDFHMSINKKERTDGSSIFMMSLIEYNPEFILTN